MTRTLHEVLLGAGLATVTGAALGLALHDLSLGLAMGAVLPILLAAERCRSAR